MVWPLGDFLTPIHEPGHPGAFAAERKFDIHTGVDLYCPQHHPISAVEDGLVVEIEKFTGEHVDSPWWNNTWAILIQGDSGVILYGEVKPREDLKVGDRVKEGESLGHVLRVLKKDKGRPMDMLHFELYDWGTRESVWWNTKGK